MDFQIGDISNVYLNLVSQPFAVNNNMLIIII